MKITIIPSDSAVYKDGYSYSGLDLSSAPADVHALQFNDTTNKGWIEFKDDDFGEKPSNQPITTLPSWANDCLTKWDEAETARLAAEEAAAEAARLAAQNQPATEGTQTL
jgi:hypothetical protein